MSTSNPDVVEIRCGTIFLVVCEERVQGSLFVQDKIPVAYFPFRDSIASGKVAELHPIVWFFATDLSAIATIIGCSGQAPHICPFCQGSAAENKQLWSTDDAELADQRTLLTISKDLNLSKNLKFVIPK